MLITGMAKRFRERSLHRSYPRTMDLHEQTLDALVQNNPRVTNPEKEIERNFFLSTGESYAVKCPDDNRCYGSTYVKVTHSRLNR